MTTLVAAHECQGQVPAYEFNQAAWTQKTQASGGVIVRMPCLTEYHLLTPSFCDTGVVTVLERSLRWQEVGSSTERELEAQMDIIARLYELQDAESVRSYLRSDTLLIPLLQAARTRIEEWFPDTTVSLEVIEDPDRVHAMRLLASVYTELVPSDALTQLDLFDEAWWIAASREAEDKVVVDVEFR